MRHSILKGFKQEIDSAVGIVFCLKKKKLLLGKAVTDDERNGKWVFPGGGVDEGESPMQASVREVYEETGISTTPLRIAMIIHPSKPTVAFFVLQQTEESEINHNEEFSAMEWFSLKELPDTLSLNIEVLKMIK